MKKSYKSLLVIVGFAALLTACDGQGDSLVNERLADNPLPTPPEYSQGNADFSTYVAIGNSLTAGYMDGALFTAGQQASLPNMLAQQFATTQEGGLTFNQPDINSESGFNTVVENPQGGLVLGRFKLDTSIPGPSPTIYGEVPAPYNGPQVHNFGVPGIQVGQLLTAATGGPNSPANPAFNPLYARFASNPGTSTILGDAVATNPTFFSLWIGNNDVLGYAASGASNEAILTSDEDFQTYYTGVITTLMDNTGANGVVADIPPLLAVPLFQAVRWNNVALDEATAGQINSGVASINQAIQACTNVGVAQSDIDRRLISYSAGNNPILVVDEDLDDLGTCFDALTGGGILNAQQRSALVPYEQSRPLVQGELVLLSAASELGSEFDGDDSVADTPIGVVVPLGFNADGSLSGDQYYLSLSELVAVETKRQTFNAIIAGVVGQYSDRIAFYQTNAAGSAFLDIFGLSDGTPGITVEGVNLEPDFSPNGVFSTDGVHPNPRGYAIIANEILEVIESSFGATLPSVSVINQPSVVICGVGDCLSEQ